MKQYSTFTTMGGETVYVNPDNVLYVVERGTSALVVLAPGLSLDVMIPDVQKDAGLHVVDTLISDRVDDTPVVTDNQDEPLVKEEPPVKDEIDAKPS